MFGLLNLNKPAGCTSRDVVTRVSRLLGRNIKVGHAGTLDPLARGVLILCVGSATRLVPFIHDHFKEYEAEFLLGKTGATADIDGDVADVEIPPGVTESALQAILPEFTGVIQQVPPAYSAVKVNGQRAYKAARRGEELELSPRNVHVRRLEINSFQLDPPEFSLSVECGTGTYIRSIGRDLARRLGTDAVMSQLVRTRIGPLTVEQGLDPITLTRDKLAASLISPLVILEQFPQVCLSEDEIRRLEFGQFLTWPDSLGEQPQTTDSVVIVDEEQRLRCLAHQRSGQLAPQLVFKLTESAGEERGGR